MKNILIFLVLSYIQLGGQVKINSNFSIKNTPFQIKELGESTHNFFYKVKFSTDSKTTNKRETICLLQVGENVSKFFDYNQLKYDSIVQNYNHKDILGAREVEELLKVKVLWSNVIVKKNNTIIVQDRFRKLYQYEEIKDNFNWKLEEGSKTILNYKCKKASLEFGGRNYTAWYTEDIPFSNGPYKFEGLPGLILEVHDSKNEFEFELIGVNSNPLSIYIRNDDKIFLVSKEKFRNIQISYYENPGFFHGKAYDTEGKEILKNSKKLPYNLIEIK